MISEWKIKSELPLSYELKNSPNVLSAENKDMLKHGNQGEGIRRIVCVDKNVAKHYINDIKNYFNYHKVNYQIVLLDGGETNKSLDSLLYLLDEIEKFGLNRVSEPIIAIGGGVMLDVVGLAATLYRRGVPYIRVPTTLLSIVDVSVAIKTGINFRDRRNRLGSYFPPLATYLDKTFIKTTTDLDISSGFGEIIKMAVSKDSKLFDIVENHGRKIFSAKFDAPYADEVISMSIEGMKVELENNLWEKNLKRVVDFGHSFSPIIEMRSLHDKSVKTLEHGQAVMLDVIFSSCISNIRNMLSIEEIKRIIKVAKDVNLDVFHPSFTDTNLLLESLNDTVKHRNGDQNLPIPIEMGKSIFVNDLTLEEIGQTVELYKRLTNE